MDLKNPSVILLCGYRGGELKGRSWGGVGVRLGSDRKGKREMALFSKCVQKYLSVYCWNTYPLIIIIIIFILLFYIYIFSLLHFFTFVNFCNIASSLFLLIFHLLLVFLLFLIYIYIYF